MSLGTILNTLKKDPKFNSKNTTSGEQKGEAIVYSVQQPLNLIFYRSKSIDHRSSTFIKI